MEKNIAEAKLAVLMHKCSTSWASVTEVFHLTKCLARHCLVLHNWIRRLWHCGRVAHVAALLQRKWVLPAVRHTGAWCHKCASS